MLSRMLLLLVTFLIGLPTGAAGQDQDEQTARSKILFTRRIAPLLQQKCLACHGADTENIEGSLDLSSWKLARAGGDSGEPAIVPNAAWKSPIFLAARRDQDDWSPMPPKEAERLTEQQLSWLEEWIDTGAHWPTEKSQSRIRKKFADQWAAEDGITVKTSGGLSTDWSGRRYDPAGLWAYQPLQKIEFPGDIRQNHVDVLIEKNLPAELAVAPQASRRVLIRRATFDLTGLPPNPDEVNDFLNDERSDHEAFASLVDRLLASPAYGERMAQHWLDVVRYADSSGFANDYERGNAWRYRDYAIRSFNDDKPFDRFIVEQIAGDEIKPGDPEGLIAVGFLRMGPWELTGMEVPRVARQRFLDDVTNSVGETFLGHSLQCARCHDHKFDPVPTRDYYSIQAVFSTTQLAERQAEFLPQENVKGFDEERFLLRQQSAYRSMLEELQTVLLKNSQKWYERKIVSTTGDAQHEWESRLKRWKAEITKAQQAKRDDAFGFVLNQFMRKGIPENEYPPKLIGFTPEQHGINRVARKGLERLKWELDRYQPFALSVYNGYTPQLKAVYSPLRLPKDRTNGELEFSCIRTNGDPFAQGEQVTPGILSAINQYVSAEIPADVDGRRTRFAKWVANENNPLTTRVIVNRIWQWHFGSAIASNANNFGSTGGRPSNPELLDYLANHLVENGWSIKSLHRTIMLSAAYQRSSEHPTPVKVAELDPLGKSHAVFPPRRLTAEELRDAMLAATGELNRTLGGIPCRPLINPEVAMQPRMVMGTFAPAWVPNPLPEQRNRRSIYVKKLRGLMVPMLEVFNSPAPDFSCERREASTVTPQVFSLFNSENSYSRALALANRVWRETEKTPDSGRDRAALIRLFELALNRSPSEQELDQLLAHWRELVKNLPVVARPRPETPLNVRREAVEENTGEKFSFKERLFSNEEFVPDLQPDQVDRHVRALADICLIVFNANEFVYIY